MEHKKSLFEVFHTDKQLMAVVSSNGILNGEFLGLYHKTRTGIENILLNSNQMMELQEVEVYLWKVHYSLIDEFRKTTRQLSSKKNETLSENVDSKSKTDQVLERYKLFLSEATEFYGDLIVKLRKSYGLPAEIFLKDRSDDSLNIEPSKLHLCHYTCHRLLICLGDIARYFEEVKKLNPRDWSTAGKYYIESTRTWPDGGNPHNQLALLATYVGDDFLALYHLVRSVAVKEPFPDAWRNLMLILEESSSIRVKELSNQIQIDFSNPSKRISLQDTYPEVHDTRDVSELWPILVRTLGFLLTRSSLEGFQCALATTIHYLEVLLILDNTELTAALESYKYMGSSRKGPYRALQLVSVFIYIAHSLTENPEREGTTENDNSQASFAPLAYTAIFICIGRLTERCARDIPVNHCPILPALTVFVEWLVGAIDAAEVHDGDERVMNAKSYFIQALVNLLDCLDHSTRTISLEGTALWEDHELMGFYPLAHLHKDLDFTDRLNCVGDFTHGKEFRFRRIIHAAKTIIDRSKKISSYKSGREFNSVRIEKPLESAEPAHMTRGNKEGSLDERAEHDLGPEPEPTLDEEEVILFKPITRRNSAPLYIMKDYSNPLGSEGTQAAHETRHDEILRRTTSLSIGRATEVDSFSFCTTTRDPERNKSGPPSLSAWVLGQEIGREKLQKNFNKQKLSPIDEIASTSFAQLTVQESKESEGLMDHFSALSQLSLPYVTPIPSAPSLPEDASWLSENSSIFPEYKSSTRTEADGILGAAPIGSCPSYRPPMGFNPGVSGLVDGYPPFFGMSSSEWLYHYRTSQNTANTSNRASPVHFNDTTFGNLHSNEVTSFDICDQWGNRFVSNPMVYMGRPQQQVYTNSSLVYGAQEQNGDKVFPDYQRPFSYVCGVGMELTASDQLPLLQYLKEKEWQMQPPGSQLRGPTYMRN